MQTTTSIKAGNAPDLLSGILSVQVKKRGKDYRTGQALLPVTAGSSVQDTQPDRKVVCHLQGGCGTVPERKTVQVRGQRQGLHPRLLFPQRAG